MPDIKRQIISLLEQLWNMNPEKRFGQLLEEFVFEDGEFFFQEDEVTIRKMKEQLGNEFNLE